MTINPNRILILIIGKKKKNKGKILNLVLSSGNIYYKLTSICSLALVFTGLFYSFYQVL
jgi:hypothetical protein